LPSQALYFIGTLNYEVVDYYTVTLSHDDIEGTESVVSSVYRLKHGIAYTVNKTSCIFRPDENENFNRSSIEGISRCTLENAMFTDFVPVAVICPTNCLPHHLHRSV